MESTFIFDRYSSSIEPGTKKEGKSNSFFCRSYESGRNRWKVTEKVARQCGQSPHQSVIIASHAKITSGWTGRERKRERAVDSGGRRAERYYLAEIMPTAHFLDVPDTTTLTGILPSAGGITTCECNRLGNLFHDANLLMACEQGRPSFGQSRIIIILKLSKNALLLLLLLSLFPSTCALAGLLLSRNGATLCIASHWAKGPSQGHRRLFNSFLSKLD